jgi:hypothetical protein
MFTEAPFSLKTFILNFAGPGRQPGYFLYWSKESNQRKDLRCAGHASAISDTFFNSPSTKKRDTSVRTGIYKESVVSKNNPSIAKEGFPGRSKKIQNSEFIYSFLTQNSKLKTQNSLLPHKSPLQRTPTHS